MGGFWMWCSKMGIGTRECELQNKLVYEQTGWLRNTPLRNNCRVSECDATHCNKARALHTRLDTCAVRFGGDKSGYTETISCSNAGMMPTSLRSACASTTTKQNTHQKNAITQVLNRHIAPFSC